MRVVNVETTFPTTTNYAHTAYTWGETEDYCFTVLPSSNCSGTPDSGTASISVSTGCPNANFTLTASNVTVGTGITYQWQSSPDGNAPWTDILGANNLVLTTNTATTTFYRLVTTCTISNQSNVTNVVSYTVAGGQCECGTYPAIFASSAADSEISNVTVGSMNNSSTCATLAPGPGSILNRYSNYTGFVVGPSEIQGATVSFSLTQTSCGGAFGNGFQIYIDWNQDGDFLDAGEQVYSQPTAASGNHTKTGTFTVPPTAPVGTTRMRVVNVETTFPTTTNYAHTAYTWGETEDYCFTVLPSSNCSGTPDSGTASISVSTGCPNANFTLTASNVTVGTGITYQWQSSPDGNAPWTDILGANNLVLTTNTATTTFYRLVTTCTISNQSNVTNVVSYTVAGGQCECGTYPAVFASSAFDEEITNVTVGSMNNSSTCATLAPGPGSILNRYSNYTGFVVGPSEIQGATVSFSLTQTSCGGFYGNGFQIYIDWNQDGDFLDAGEQVYSQPASVTGNHTVTGTFTVPVTAPVGTTRMRVVNVETTFPTTINYAHTTYTWGETEDYCFTVLPAPNCSGTPAPGNTLSSLPNPCPTENFTLSLQNQTSGSGVSYQWQTSSDGINWTNATGSPNAATWTTTHASATWYRCIVTCVPSGQSTASNGVLVGTSICYCAAQYTSGKTLGDLISQVTIPGTTLNNVSGTQPVNPAYTYFTGQPNYTANLVQGGTYNVTIAVGTWGDQHIRAWIDYNDDGTFDPSESIGSTVIAPGQGNTGPFPPAVFPVTLANNAPLGTHRMRIRGVWSITPNFHTTIDPCATYSWGETEDYDITIVPPVTTQLQAGSCGATNVAPNQLLFAVNVGAPVYRFRFNGPNNGGPGWNNNTFIVDRPNRYVYFNHLVPGFQFGATYSVDVAVGDGNGNFGPYGPACNVTLQSNVPLTQIQASLCGSTVNGNTLIFANQIFDAQGYRFRITGPNNGSWPGGVFILDRPVRYFYFNNLVPGATPGGTFTVEVAYLQNDGQTYSPYGPVCNVTLNAPLQSPIIENNDIFVDNKTMSVVEFGANASHNPFTTDFGIQVLNANDVETINVSIYDMSGKLIERNAVHPMDIENARFGAKLASGMYMIEVRQGTNQAVIRQVKN
jgi:hypothetical protein